MPKVLHFNKVSAGEMADAVFIGRPSKWGNPFVIGVHGTRREVIKKYQVWLDSHPMLKHDAIAELQGKNLLCYCSPKRCHGDVLLALANPKADLFKK